MSTTTPTVDDFLLGGSAGKSAFAKDDVVGTTVTGVIVGTEVRQQTDIKDGTPLVWENGDPRMQLVVSLQTDQRLDAEDDGCRALYVKGSKTPGSKSLHDAVRAAVQEVGAKGIEVGGTLTVSYIGSEPSATRGFSDRKLWAAQYQAPDRAAQTGEYLGTTQATTAQPANPAPQPAAVPAPQPVAVATPAPVAAAAPAPAPAPAPAAAPAADSPADKAKQLIALGLDDNAIAGALGLDASVVALLRTAA